MIKIICLDELGYTIYLGALLTLKKEKAFETSFTIDIYLICFHLSCSGFS